MAEQRGRGSEGGGRGGGPGGRRSGRSTRPRRARAEAGAEAGAEAATDAAAGTVAETVVEGGRATAAAAGAIRHELASHPAGLAVAGLLVSFVLGYFVGAHRRALAGLPPRRR